MNKLGTKLGAIAMSAVMALTFAPSAAITSLAASGDGLLDATYGVEPVYRFYNPNTGEHLFTTSVAEADYLEDENWDNEGAKWYAPYISTKGIYRLYNPSTGEHLYTSDGVEIAHLVNNENWEKDFGGYPAFYAVDNAFDSDAITIGRFFNPAGTGVSAHIFSADPAEIGALKDKGYTEETGFRGYPLTYKPDEPVEELTVSIDNPTPKVGDTIRVLIHDEDGNEVNPADVDAKIQWYCGSKTLTGETDAELDVTSDMVGYVLSVIVTIDDEEYTDDTAAVEAKKVVAATLIDVNGLQNDGTALVGDTLRVTYTQELGTPSAVAWYKDGTALESTIASAGTLTFTIDTTTYGKTAIVADAEDAGDWYAVITDQEGNMYESNHIKVVFKGETAVMSGLSLTEVYTSGTGIDFANASDQFILTVTLNKANYDGTFWLFKDTEKDFVTKNAVGVDNTAGGGTDGTETGYTTAGATAQDFKTQLVDDKATTAGISWTNTDTDEITYKFKLDLATTANIKRGSKYYVVFDQDQLDTDDIGTAKNENANKSELVTAPYVTAPAAIKVTDVQTLTTTAGWTATLYTDADATTKAEYITGIANNTAGHTLKLYTNTSSNTQTGTVFGTLNTSITKGKSGVTTNAAASAQAYVYAIYNAPKGIYQADAFELVSEGVPVAQDAWTGVIVSTVSTDNKSVEVTYDGLKTAGTIYLVSGSNKVKAGTPDGESIEEKISGFKASDSSTYITSAEVKRGAEKTIFENVISKVNDTTNGDAYEVIFVPTSEEYTTTKGGTNFNNNSLDINQKFSKVSVVKQTIDLSDDTSAATIAFKELDQYGAEMKTYAALPTMTVKPSSTNTAAGTITSVAGTNAGEADIASADSAVYAAGDSYTFDIHGSKVLVSITAGGTEGVDDIIAYIEVTN